MAKFSGSTTPRTMKRGPVRTDNGQTVTHEGGAAYTLDAKSELFTLACTSLVGEDTFYESARDRDSRLVRLIHQVVDEDPDWLRRFVPYLRGEMRMRSAPVVLACEYVVAGGEGGRKVIDSACQRPDEPAEILGYWLQAHGKPVPKPVKRGVADAAVRMYNERSAIKYDGSSRGVRMGDVIQLTHPKPKGEWQSDLFKYLVGKRLRHVQEAPPETLETLLNNYALQNEPVEKRREFLANPNELYDGGFTWEMLSGWLQGPMDAEAWEAIIPSMGAMALTRNLRNFDEAGVSDEAAQQVIAKLTSEEEILKSRQLPYRFWSAYRSVSTTRWVHPLEVAMGHATKNVPEIGGRTLVLIDVSGSMNFTTISSRSVVKLWEVGAVFAGSLGKACEEVSLVPFADGHGELDTPKTFDVLPAVQNIERVVNSGELGHATRIWEAVDAHYDKHDRICIFTDMQSHDDKIHDYDCPVYAFDLAGYRRTGMELGPRKYQLAGYSDAVFKMMDALENSEPGAGEWPF